jgi:hypothetical protein
MKALKRLWKRIFRRIKRFRKDNNSNLNTIVVCISVIMVWRWIWDLLDYYVFPNNPLLSDVLCIMLWIAVLLIDDWKLGELADDSPKA